MKMSTCWRAVLLAAIFCWAPQPVRRRLQGIAHQTDRTAASLPCQGQRGGLCRRGLRQEGRRASDNADPRPARAMSFVNISDPPEHNRRQLPERRWPAGASACLRMQRSLGSDALQASNALAQPILACERRDPTTPSGDASALAPTLECTP
jgi:hypothetical protein